MNYFCKTILSGVFAFVSLVLCGAAAHDPAAEAAKLKGTKITISESDIKELGMKFEVIEVKVPNLKKEYDFIFISDLHVMADDASELAANRKSAMIYRRDKHFNNPHTNMRPLHVWQKLPALLNKSNADAVFFAADMCDTGSIANISALRDGMKQVKIPFVYTREDHDASAWNLISKDVSKQNAVNAEIDGYPPFKIIEYDDLIIFAHSRSLWHTKEPVLGAFGKVCAGNKPVIVVQHCPIVKPGLKEWQKRHVWNGKIKPGHGTLKYMDLLHKPDGNARLIVSGHSHCSADFMLTPTLRSHIFDAAFKGFYGIIKIRKQ